MNLLNKSNIANGNIIEADDVYQMVDAFTYQVAYDLLISGSIAMGSGSTAPGVKLYISGGNIQVNNGSVSASSFTGSFLGNGSGVTGIISSSYTLSSSYSSFSQLASSASVAFNVSGAMGYIGVFNSAYNIGPSLMLQSGSSIILNNGSGPTNYTWDVGGTGRFTSNLTVSGGLFLGSALYDNTLSSGNYGQVLQSTNNGLIWVSTISSSISSSHAVTASYALNFNIPTIISGNFGYFPIFLGPNNLGTSIISQSSSGVISISGSLNIVNLTGSTLSINNGLVIGSDSNLYFLSGSGKLFNNGNEYVILPGIGYSGSSAGVLIPFNSSSGWSIANSVGSYVLSTSDNIIRLQSSIDFPNTQGAHLIYTGSNITGFYNLNLHIGSEDAGQFHQGTHVSLKGGNGGNGSNSNFAGIPGNLYLGAGNAQSGSLIFNSPGGNLYISGGVGTGTGSSGVINFYTATSLITSSTSSQSLSLVMSISQSNVVNYGTLYVSGALRDSSGSTGSAGQILSSTTSGTLWANGSSGSIITSSVFTQIETTGSLISLFPGGALPDTISTSGGQVITGSNSVAGRFEVWSGTGVGSGSVMATVILPTTQSYSYKVFLTPYCDGVSFITHLNVGVNPISTTQFQVVLFPSQSVPTSSNFSWFYSIINW